MDGIITPKRIIFLLMMSLGAVLPPRVANSQAETKVARIGWMSRGNPTDNDSNMDAFHQGMRELGYMEGRTFVIETRYAGGKSELMPEQAADLERAGVDVIIAGPFEALQDAPLSSTQFTFSPPAREGGRWSEPTYAGRLKRARLPVRTG